MSLFTPPMDVCEDYAYKWHSENCLKCIDIQNEKLREAKNKLQQIKIAQEQDDE